MAPPSEVALQTLRTLTTLGVGGPAELWHIESVADLRDATRERFRVLGAGSNLLVADSGVSERVIKLGRAFNALPGLTLGPDMWVGAATPLPGLVRRAMEAGLSGLEGLLGIPAVVGGAVAMNAGTRFGELSDTLKEVEVFLGGALERVAAEDLGLGYRSSKLPDDAVVTAARLQLVPSHRARVAAKMAEVDAARASQPKVKSAGCAFKNPPGDSAGRIIDASGLKGLTVGRAMIAEEHGNFVVNLGGATAADILELIRQVVTRVESPLELEWRLWGFEEHP